jgi:hypothetical protein
VHSGWSGHVALFVSVVPVVVEVEGGDRSPPENLGSFPTDNGCHTRTSTNCTGVADRSAPSVKEEGSTEARAWQTSHDDIPIAEDEDTFEWWVG